MDYFLEDAYNNKKRVQRVIGGVLCYRRSVDLIVLPALGYIASEQASATKSTKKKCEQLLDYIATNDNAKIRYYASNMVLKFHLYAYYHSETQA